MTLKRRIGWFLESSSSMKFFHPSVRLTYGCVGAVGSSQPKATRVCIRSINQSNRSICVLLLFLFCSRVFISRSYENLLRCFFFSFAEITWFRLLGSIVFSLDWLRINSELRRYETHQVQTHCSSSIESFRFAGQGRLRVRDNIRNFVNQDRILRLEKK